MITVDFDEMSYQTLIRILQEKYYSTTELQELAEINQIYKALRFKSETWLSKI